jgi:hypothetical protein
MKDVLHRRFKHLLQANEAAGRAAAGLFVLVKQPTALLQPQAQTVEPEEGRQTADNDRAPNHDIREGHAWSSLG